MTKIIGVARTAVTRIARPARPSDIRNMKVNRDPENRDCTRDPIYLLQIADWQWTQIPAGLESNGESWIVTEPEALDDWIRPFIVWDKDNVSGTVRYSKEFFEVAEKIENDHGWPMVYLSWRTESVFLTRTAGEDYAEARSYRWTKWKVYCVPCEGELAEILRNYQRETDDS